MTGTRSLQKTSDICGREQELDVLRRALNTVKNGTSHLVLIDGETGVGKTALAEAFRADVEKANGTFISGKFDEQHRDVPFNALVHGFRSYIEQEILANENRLNGLRELLKESLGDQLSLVARAIPPLLKVIGPSLANESAHSFDQRERLQAALLRFIFVFTSREEPLVIFMDDLHWADSASRQLILSLLTANKSNGMLIISSMRGKEVSDSHPVYRMLTELAQARVRYSRIVLGNLDVTGVRCVTQARRSDQGFFDGEIDELAKLIFSKTSGNPFFIKQMFRCLIEAGALGCVFRLRRPAVSVRFRPAIGA